MDTAGGICYHQEWEASCRLIQTVNYWPEAPVESVVEIPFAPASLCENEVSGNIDVLDVRFGSLWTNIPWGNFARAYNVGTGLSWRITMRRSTLNR